MLNRIDSVVVVIVLALLISGHVLCPAATMGEVEAQIVPTAPLSSEPVSYEGVSQGRPLPKEAPSVSQSGTSPEDKGLTAVPGIRVGQVTLPTRPTGCTVVLAPEGTVGGVDVRGGAPATRETDLLRPENLVSTVHAVVLSGGSAYGLDSAGGVMRYLEEQGVGFPVRGTVVPIVVGASLLDLGLSFEGYASESSSEKERRFAKPGADCGYRAAGSASDAPVARGNVGAGAGGTVGKLRGLDRAMKAGTGSASMTTKDGLVIAALVAVNAVGDVVDPRTGQVVAGVRDLGGPGQFGSLADARVLLREDEAHSEDDPGSARDNTTLGVVATNARLTKAEATKFAQMAHDGFARALVPAHTPGDGDAIFSLATGSFEGTVSLSTLGSLAAEVMAEAIVDAAQQAEGLPGLPAARDFP